MSQKSEFITTNTNSEFLNGIGRSSKTEEQSKQSFSWTNLACILTCFRLDGLDRGQVHDDTGLNSGQKHG